MVHLYASELAIITPAAVRHQTIIWTYGDLPLT